MGRRGLSDCDEREGLGLHWNDVNCDLQIGLTMRW